MRYVDRCVASMHVHTKPLLCGPSLNMTVLLFMAVVSSQLEVHLKIAMSRVMQLALASELARG